MATSKEFLKQLSDDTAVKITSSSEEWLKYCQSASNLYRYPFGDQLLIYAQRPDAKQCATFDYWNQTMHCYVKKGAKAIALMGDGNRPQYVFDMSDVHKVSEKSRMPFQWELAEERKTWIIERLENNYMYPGTLPEYKEMDFGDRIIQLADRIAADMTIDPDVIKGSALEEVFEENRAEIMQDALSASVASMILARCGEDVSLYAGRMTGFQYINMFNTPEAVFELGTATAELAKPVLIDIEKEMALYEKSLRKERSIENGDRVHSERGLSDSEPGSRTDIGSGVRDREVRRDEENVPSGTQTGNVRETSLDRRADESSDRGGQGSLGEKNEHGGTAEEEKRSERAASETEHRSVHNKASGDIQRSGSSDNRRNDPDLSTGITVVLTNNPPRLAKPVVGKAYIRVASEEDFYKKMESAKNMKNLGAIQVDSSVLTEFPALIEPYNDIKAQNKENGIPTSTLIRVGSFAKEAPEPPKEVYEQISLFPSVGEQVAIVEEAEKESDEKEDSMLDDILRTGGGNEDSKLRIYAKYLAHKSPVEMVDFLKNEYGKTGKGFEFDGKKYSVWFSESGMDLAEGTSAKDSPDLSLSWEQIERKIRRLVDYGEYLPASEAAEVDSFERNRVSESIYFFFRDGMDEFPESLEASGSNFPDSTEHLAELLSTSEGRNLIASEILKAKQALDSGEEELKWRHVKSPEYLLDEIADLDTERVVFYPLESVDVKIESFITDDEINTVLAGGSGVSEGKFRIIEEFKRETDSKERIKFLKNEYGMGGRSHALPGCDKGWEDHDAKGIKLTKGDLLNPNAKVLLSWNDVEKRISDLIESEQYLNPKEKEELAKRMSAQLNEQIENGEFENAEDERDSFEMEDQSDEDFFNDAEIDEEEVIGKEDIYLTFDVSELKVGDVVVLPPQHMTDRTGKDVLISSEKNTITDISIGADGQTWFSFKGETGSISGSTIDSLSKSGYELVGHDESFDKKELSADEQFFADIPLTELAWRVVKHTVAWDEIGEIGNALYGDRAETTPQAYDYMRYGHGLDGSALVSLSKQFKEGNDMESFDRELVSGLIGNEKTLRISDPDDIKNMFAEANAEKTEEGLILSVGSIKREVSFETLSNEFLKRVRDEFEQNNPPMFNIYQIKDGEEYHGIRFAGISEIAQSGVRINKDDYDQVYHDYVYDELIGKDTEEILEGLFDKFNNDRPWDFHGHSLSVSDVVGITDAYGNEKAYFVDRFGFKEFPNFFKEKEVTQEISLPNVKVEWSESPIFEDGKVYSVEEYDRIMHDADLARHNAKRDKITEYGSYQKWIDSDDPELADLGGYDKVKFTVNYADGTSWTNRHDIGDGIGGLLEHMNYYAPERVPELAEAAGRELDKMPYKLVTHLKGDPIAPSYATSGDYRTIEDAEFDGRDFLRSHEGYGIYDLEAGTCVKSVGIFDPDVPVQTNVLGADFKEIYKGIPADKLSEIDDSYLNLTVGDHLVDQDGVLWEIKDNGFSLNLEKAPENMVDTLVAAKSIWNWTNHVQEKGKLDEFDDYRKISVEDYLAEQSAKTLKEVTQPSEKELYFFVTDGAEFNEELLADTIPDIKSLDSYLESNSNAKAIGISIHDPKNDATAFGGFDRSDDEDYHIVDHNRLFFDVIRRYPNIWNNDKARDMIDQVIINHPEIELYDENGIVDRNEYLAKIGASKTEFKLSDIQNLKYDGTEISNGGHTAEHTFDAVIIGEPSKLFYEVTRHDGDEESFSIRTDNLDLMDGEILSLDDVRALEEILHKEVYIGRYEQKIASVESLSELKNVEFAFMDDERFPKDMNVRFWDAYRTREAELNGIEHTVGQNVQRTEDRGYTVSDRQSYSPEKTGLPYEVVTETLRFDEPELKAESRNFHITDEALGTGGAKEKFRRNIEAIKTLKQIEAEGRTATPEEQKTLSQYVGWGGLANAFDDRKTDWNAEYYELKGLLADDEYKAARASTTEAFYTSPTIISGIYDTLGRMGFDGGNVLEPSCGVGNFFGMLPESMEKSKLYGIELDSISGRIAKQLYPDANIQVTGYEKTNFTNNTFDVAVGNVPFGEVKPFDPDYKKQNFLIHDYFFAKTLDKVRPGGVIAFVTSTGTMDKENPKVRKYIADRAELLGAVRLPGGKDGAFKANAGTEVDSDIIFLKKRPTVIDSEDPWIHRSYDENGIALNEYFANHPEQIVGSMQMVSSQFGEKSLCVADTTRPFKEQLSKALSNISGTIDPPEKVAEDIKANIGKNEIPASPDVRNYSFTVVGDDIYFRVNSEMKLATNAQGKPLNDKMKAQYKGLIGLRETVRELLQAQVDDAPDDVIKGLQDKLNADYDSFVKKYGYLSPTKKKKLNKETGEMETVTHVAKSGKVVEDIDRDNFNRFHDDDSYSLLMALEDVEDYEYKGKSDIFTKRTIARAVAVTSVETASEALTVCLNEKAKVDLDFMSELCHKPVSEIVSDLRGVIFKNPLSNEFETSEEYLSGNIRSKLALAQSFAVNDPDLAINVQALEEVMPEPLSATDIEVRLGSTWIDAKYIDQFMAEVLDTPSNYFRWGMIKTDYSPITGGWFIEGKTKDTYNVKANNVYGTSRRNAYTILEDALNLKPSEVYDTKEVDGKVKREINRDETILAQQKQDALKEAFKEWIFKDPERRETLVNKYNEQFNSVRPRTFSGSHLEFPGSNQTIKLYEHQKDGVARILYGNNTLLAHCVGAGKTFTMVAGAMESKRLGLCKKSMFVVPNHLTEQWGSDFRKFYPDANILVIGKSDFSDAEKRKKFTARIATGDYDAVIIGHSTFKKIALSPEKEAEFLQTEVDRYQAAINMMDSKENRHSIKEIEKMIKEYEGRIDALLNGSKKDTHISFEELGIDRLFVDESHAYKNLYFPTKMSRIPGVNTTRSQAATQMQAICRYMDEKTGGKGVTFATGTPISNSMTELYTNMSFLQNGTLRQMNLDMFDKWASSFGETTTAMEVTPTGTGYQAKTRFANFFNIPELMNLFKESADIRTPDMLNLDIPEVEYEDVVLEKSPEQQAILDALDERVTIIKNGGIDPAEDNMLKITNDGRKMALDQRLINPLLPENPNSKVNAVAEKAFEIYKDAMDDKSTQLIFSDLGTPGKDKDGNVKFSVYDEIKRKLMEKGVPADEIAFIHDFDNDADKQKLFAKVRAGRVRFLLGSTQKMGAGTNVQDKLIALHHVDVPWRPSDLEQQEGRILRQGNTNPKVKIFRYITKGTFDAYNWQTIEHKQSFISQIMTSKSPVRCHDDVDDATLAYAAVKALCADNPLIQEKMELDVDIQKLQIAKSAYKKQIYTLQDSITKVYPKKIAESKAEIAGFKADIANYNSNKPADKDDFKIIVGGRVFEDKKEGAEVLVNAIRAKTDIVGDYRKIGEYRGFEIHTQFNPFENCYRMKLVGETAHYIDDVAKDAFGTITKMNNALENMPKYLDNHISNLAEVEKQLANAKEEVEKPFSREQELVDKLARQSELNGLLKMDEKAENIIIGSGATDYKNVVREVDDEIPELNDSLEEDGKSASKSKSQERDKLAKGEKVNISGGITKDDIKPGTSQSKDRSKEAVI